MKSRSTIPWLATAILAAAYAPSILASSLLQGDMPGHLEVVRRYAEHIWPLPWGWDPRYLGGAPLGILYPPLLGWLGGGLGKLIGAEAALKALLWLSVAALPWSLFHAARGLGLGRRGAHGAMLLAVVFLWLPGLELGSLTLGWRGLGGSLRQTLGTGNATNALALPLLCGFLARLRVGIARPGRWPLPAAFLALCLLSHFLVGAAAGITLAAFTLWRGLRRRSLRSMTGGTLIAVAGLVAAAPFLVPFVVHLREASPDAIGFSPLPIWFEWLMLAVLAALVLARRPRGSHPLLPVLLVLLVFYLCRGVVFPLFGTPPVRMEYHRFRMLLYLALCPAVFLWLRSIPRWLPTAGVVAVALLAVGGRHDARGPVPVPAPSWSVDGGRLLVMASPEAQNGSDHGLQVTLPQKLGIPGTKGVFVESSPLAQRVFELERLAAGAGTRQRWWAIRVAGYDELARLHPAEVAARFAELGVDRVLAREPVSPMVHALSTERSELDHGYTLYRLPLAAPGALDGTRIEVAPGPSGSTIVAVNAFSDWRVADGKATLDTVPPGLIRVRGEGPAVLAIAPRLEEWLGLVLGLIGWGVVARGIMAGRG